MIIDVVEASLLLDYLLSDPTLASIISAGGSFFRLEAICRWFIGCEVAYGCVHEEYQERKNEEEAVQ
jgi:hypothetical protein